MNDFYQTLFLTIVLFLFDTTNSHGEEPANYPESVLLPIFYSKQTIPAINGSQLTISIGIEIIDLVSVVESGQFFIVDLIFYQKWKDPRVMLPNHMKKNDEIVLDYSWTTKLWTPDTYFSNALESKVLNVINPIIYFTITGDKQIVQTIRMNVKFQCKMDLSQYPQDVQYCPIDIISLTQNNKSIELEWDYFKSPSWDDHPKFRIRQTNIFIGERHNRMGNFRCLTAKLKLVRRVSYYMIRIYGPTFLTTISSFVGFWIPVLAWPARVALLVTPLLTLVTQNLNINTEINVSYVVAIHWWMSFCIFFVFMSLIEFAVAISWAWRANDRKALRVSEGRTEQTKYHGLKDDMFCRCGRVVGNILFHVFGNIDYTKEPLNRNKVDYASRIIFPLTFLAFVVIYILSTLCPWAVHYNK